MLIFQLCLNDMPEHALHDISYCWAPIPIVSVVLLGKAIDLVLIISGGYSILLNVLIVQSVNAFSEFLATLDVWEPF